MTLTFVVLLILAVAIVTVGALYGRRAFDLFTLSDHKRHPDRLSDHLPWAMLVAPGVVFNKNG